MQDREAECDDRDSNQFAGERPERGLKDDGISNLRAVGNATVYLNGI